MSVWDVLETGFGEDEETANFGPRQESGSALYQVSTFATMSPREKDCADVPNVAVEVSDDLFCVSVDKHLCMFEDYRNTIMLSFDFLVDDMVFSPDKSLLIIGDQKGVLYILDVKKMEIIFSFNILAAQVSEGQASFQRILFMDRGKGKLDLLVLALTGKLIVFKEIDLDLFSEDVNNITMQLKSKLKFQLINTAAVHTNGTLDVLACNDKILTMGCGETILSKWIWKDGELQQADAVGNILMNNAGIQKGKLTANKEYLFVLDNAKTLTLWSTEMMFILQQYSEVVMDFEISDSGDLPCGSLINMKVILTLVVDGTCQFEVRQLPDFSTVYQLKLNSLVWLVPSCPLQESLYVVEGSEEENPSGVPECLRFRCVTESNPTARLSTLLHKKHFEKAKTFAKQYGLDMELVYNTHISHLLDRLSYWNVQNLTAEEKNIILNELWSSMKLVKDDRFLTESCAHAALPSYDDTYSLLEFLKTRLVQKFSKGNQDSKCSIGKLLKLVLDIQHRLITFELAFGKSKYNPAAWDVLRRADMFKEMLESFQKGFVNLGILFWRRYEHEFQGKLSREVIENILNSWIDHQHVSGILVWLVENLIPCVIRTIPEVLVCLVNWLVRKARNMELLEKEDWPTNALQFLQSVLGRCQSLLETSPNALHTSGEIVLKTSINIKQVLQPVVELISGLQKLIHLDKNYDCKMTFSQFLQENTETIVFRMLDQVVALELIESSLDRIIRPYIKENQLKEDEIFSRYIKDLLERTRYIAYRREARWEAKAIAIISCIRDPEQKCSGILEVIKCAPIPWSPAIQQLVDAGMKISHPSIEEIKKQCHLVKIKEILLKYEFDTQANIVIPGTEKALRLAYMILVKSKPSSLDDAIQVIKHSDCQTKIDLYTFQMRLLIGQDRIDEFIDLLTSLDQPTAIACSKHLLIYVTLQLDEKPIVDEQIINRNKHLFTRAGKFLTRFLLSTLTDLIDLKEIKKTQHSLQGIFSLQIEFGKYIGIEEFEDEKFRENCLLNYAKNLLLRNPEMKKSYLKMKRFAELLQISQAQLVGELATLAAETGDLDVAIDMCRELFEMEPCAKTAKVLYQVAIQLSTFSATSNDEQCNCKVLAHDLPAVICRLTSQALTICEPDLITKCLQLCKCTSLMTTACRQSESGDYNMSIQGFKADGQPEPFKIWSLDVHHFKEDAVIMESSEVLPLAVQYTLHDPLLKISGAGEDLDANGSEESFPKALALKRYFEATHAFLHHLQTNRNDELAFQVLMHLQSTAQQFIFQNCVGFTLSREETKESKILKEMLTHNFPVNITVQMILNILKKIFNSFHIDHQLAVGYRLSLSNKFTSEDMKLLYSQAGHNYRKLVSLAKVGAGLSEVSKNSQMMDLSKKLETCARWGYKLEKLKINFKDAFHGPVSEKVKILPQIACLDSVDMLFIKEYCRDFQLDEDDGLLTYVENLVLMPPRLAMDADQKVKRLKRARAAIAEIQTKNRIVKKLQDLVDQVSYYDYETLRMLLDEERQLENSPSVDKGLRLLDYLVLYKRQFPPSNYELHYRPDGAKVDIPFAIHPLSKDRLPFHALFRGNPWKIISKELTADNITTWLLLGQVLNLPSDCLYMITIKNMVMKYVASFNESTATNATVENYCNWDSREANYELLAAVKGLILKIKDCESALALATYMIKELPMGATKVLVLEDFVLFAKKWYCACPEKSQDRMKAESTASKFSKLYHHMATKQVLLMHNMATPEYLELCDDPLQLIWQLYKHPSIHEQFKGSELQPDINAIVEQIALLGGLDIEEIKMGLVEKWLPQTVSKMEDADTTMVNFLDLKVIGKEDNAADEHNLKRLTYIMKHGDVEKNINQLLTYVFDAQPDVLYTSRIRALFCLLGLADDSEIQRFTNTSATKLRQMLWSFQYLADLEKLHIHYSLRSFEECNKEKLAKGLLKNHSHEKAALVLILNLCLDCGVYDVQLWDAVLKQMKIMALVKELKNILMKLPIHAFSSTIPSLPHVWQTVVMDPLTKVLLPLSDDQREECFHVFDLLQRCPVLQDLDLIQISKLYLHLKLNGCALVCHLSSNSDKDGLQGFLSAGIPELLDDLALLKLKCTYSAMFTQAENILFQTILEKEDFAAIFNTPHLTTFARYAIQMNQVDGLLLYSIRNNRVQQAIQFFDMYRHSKPDALTGVSEDGGQDSYELLKAYLQTR